MASDYLAISGLQGVPDSPIFDTFADGSESVLVKADQEWPGFVLVDNSDGTQTKLKMADAEQNSLLSYKNNEHCSILVSDRSILSLVRNQQNGTYFLVEYLVNDAKKSLRLHKEYPLGVQHPGHTFADMQNYGNNIYVIIWWHDDSRRVLHNTRNPITGFHVLRFERGSINHGLHVETFAANKTVDGEWFGPFVSEGALIFVNYEKICIISLSDAGSVPEYVHLRSLNVTPPSKTHCSPPRLFKGLAYYYIFDPESKMGQIWTLSQEEKKWKWTATNMWLKSHPLSERMKLTITESEIAFLHGSCADSTCTSKAHIYQLDVSKRLQWNRAEEIHIGHGGFANVYAIKVNDGKQEQNYAIKVLKSELLAHQDDLVKECYVRLAISEARRVKSLSHSAIVKCFGFYFERDRIVTIMEYCDRTLKKLISLKKEKCLTEFEMIIYLGQLVEAVFYLHTRPKPIIHRDIKCDNILISSEGKAKLSDFGLGKEIKLTEDFQTRTSCAPHDPKGTIHWMAPEVHDKQVYGRRADIWSIGCTCVEMLTGNPPYHNISTNEYPRKLLAGELSFRPHDLIKNRQLSAAVVNVLEKMFVHNIISSFQRATSHTSSMRKSYKNFKRRFVNTMHNQNDNKEQKEHKKSKSKTGIEEQTGVLERLDVYDILADVRKIQLDIQFEEQKEKLQSGIKESYERLKIAEMLERKARSSLRMKKCSMCKLLNIL